MYYIIYLLGIVFYFFKGIGIHKIFPGFIENLKQVFILFQCFFILFCKNLPSAKGMLPLPNTGKVLLLSK